MQSAESDVQQLNMFADAAKEKHLCLDCGTDISHQRRDAQLCEPCSYSRTKERAKNFYRENRTRVLQRAKSRQQTPEYKQLRQEWEEKNPEKIKIYRQRHKQKYRVKTGYNPEGRTCEDCHADISHRGHNAKKCVPCSTSPARTCVVCRIDISHKGPEQHSVANNASNAIGSRMSWRDMSRHVRNAMRPKSMGNSGYTTIAEAQSARVAKQVPLKNINKHCPSRSGEESVAFRASVREMRRPIYPWSKKHCLEPRNAKLIGGGYTDLTLMRIGCIQSKRASVLSAESRSR